MTTDIADDCGYRSHFVEVLDNPATEEGVLLKVMTRGSFEQGQQIWIVDRDRSKVGATVENVLSKPSIVR